MIDVIVYTLYKTSPCRFIIYNIKRERVYVLNAYKH